MHYLTESNSFITFPCLSNIIIGKQLFFVLTFTKVGISDESPS
nr:MAG TPA: hypothetical protein [Bacteriophage sp.]